MPVATSEPVSEKRPPLNIGESGLGGSGNPGAPGPWENSVVPAAGAIFSAAEGKLWRLESGGKDVRLRGTLKMEAGKAVAAGASPMGLPAAAGPLIITKFSVYNETEGKTIVWEIKPNGEVKTATEIKENAVVILEGTTYSRE